MGVLIENISGTTPVQGYSGVTTLIRFTRRIWLQPILIQDLVSVYAVR